MKKEFLLISTLIICSAINSAAQATKPKAYVIAELGPVPESSLTLAMNMVLTLLKHNDDSESYIFNYGTAGGIRAQKIQLTKANGWRCGYAGCGRITFVDVPVKAKVRTVIWIIPPGSEIPTP